MMYMDKRIKRLLILPAFLMYLLNIAAVDAADTVSDWGFSATVGWAWRDISGTMFSYSPPLNGAATAESLGLGSSSEADAAIGVRWKRLNIEFVYLPSKFSGNGVLVQDLDYGSGPVIGNTTPISSDIEVTMKLANVEYMILQRHDMDLGIGAGFGQVELDIKMTPQIGPEVNISGDVPFGYLTASFVKRWGKLALNVGLQGLSVSRNDTSVTYSSMNIAGAYRLLQREKLGLDILGGYRYVDFDYEFDDDSTGISTGTDFELTGPYVGLRASW